MSGALVGAALVIAVLNWLAIERGWKPLEYLAKPGVMVALLLWWWSLGGFQGQSAWFALGLLFSLAGDILLMLPEERFVAGLAAFSLAHLAYLAGFQLFSPPANLAAIALALLVGATGAQVSRRVIAALERRGKAGLRAPVLAYSVLLCLMLYAALLTLARPDDAWQPRAALLAGAGALLFFLSDTLLAWNKFVAPLPHGRLKVMASYHLGQVGILAGVALNFLL